MAVKLVSLLGLMLVAGFSFIIADNQQLLNYIEERADMADTGRGQEEGTHAPLLSVIEDRASALPRQQQELPQQVCARWVIDSCDMKAMALLQMVDGSVCTLLKEYSMCVKTHSLSCSSPEVTKLMSGLDYLFSGFTSKGHCLGTGASRAAGAKERCGRTGVWRCVASLSQDLKAFHKGACAALTDFHRCLRAETVTCDDVGSRKLQVASRRLRSIYHRRDVTSC